LRTQDSMSHLARAY